VDYLCAKVLSAPQVRALSVVTPIKLELAVPVF